MISVTKAQPELHACLMIAALRSVSTALTVSEAPGAALDRIRWMKYPYKPENTSCLSKGRRFCLFRRRGERHRALSEREERFGALPSFSTPSRRQNFP